MRLGQSEDRVTFHLTQAGGAAKAALLAALACGAFAATGCEGPAPAGAPPEAGNPSAANLSGSAADRPPVAANYSRLAADTPLGPYREALDGPVLDPAEQVAKAKDQFAQKQDLIAECMQKAGFEYTPQVSGVTEFSFERYIGDGASKLWVPPLAEDRDVVARWGYGLDPPDYYKDPIDDMDLAAQATATENAEYFDSLSPSAQDAYNTAFQGYAADAPGPAPETGGCLAAADAAVPTGHGTPEWWDAQYGDLSLEVKDVSSLYVPEDPDAVALHKEWAACMTEAGHAIDEPQLDQEFLEMLERTEQRLSDVGYDVYASPSRAVMQARKLDSGSEGDSEAGVSLLKALPGQVAIAVADFDCRQQTDYMDRLMAIEIRVEQRFLDERKAELDELLEAAKRPAWED
jgi:hypothetical protein